MMYNGGFYEPERTRKKLKNSDMYVVRLLPPGRKIQGSSELDPARFGNSKPCVHCVRALDAVGVRRVVYTVGDKPGTAGDIDYEVRTVRELLQESDVEGGHSSRGNAASQPTRASLRDRP